MQLGFSAKECRMALRACRKDPEQAAIKLLQRKEDIVREKAEARRKEQERKELFRYGRTANGKPVDATLVKGACAWR
jgi:DNA-binding transcriptional MerR regulator